MSDARDIASVLRGVVTPEAVSSAVSTHTTVEIAAVYRRRLGAELSEAVTSADLTVTVDDVTPFAEEMQALLSDDETSETVTITEVDEEASTLTLERTSPADWPAGASVYVEPAVNQSFADVFYSDDTEDVMEAVPVSASMASKLVAGERERGQGETVVVRKTDASSGGHDWAIVDFADQREFAYYGPDLKDEYGEYDLPTSQSAINAIVQPMIDGVQVVADAAQSDATAALAAADAAQLDADAANASVAQMAADDILSPVEKPSLRSTWDAIVSERTKLHAQADAYGTVAAIDTAQSTLDTKYAALGTFLNGAAWSIGGAVPTYIADANLGTATDLGSGGGATLRTRFKEYTDARQDLLKAITDRAKALADAAQSAANQAQADATTAISNAASAQASATTAINAAAAKAKTFFTQPTTPYVAGDLWFDSGGIIKRCTIARASGAFNSGDWSLWALMADYVKANVSLDSPVITGGIVTGGIFRTAASGPRVELDYASRGTEVVSTADNRQGAGTTTLIPGNLSTQTFYAEQGTVISGVLLKGYGVASNSGFHVFVTDADDEFLPKPAGSTSNEVYGAYRSWMAWDRLPDSAAEFVQHFPDPVTLPYTGTYKLKLDPVTDNSVLTTSTTSTYASGSLNGSSTVDLHFAVMRVATSGQVRFHDNNGVPAGTLSLVDGELRIGGRTRVSRLMELASGSVTVTPSTQESADGVFPSTWYSASVNVSFPSGRFSTAPKVALSLNTTVPQRCVVARSNVTASGFTIVAGRTNTTSFGVDWIATSL